MYLVSCAALLLGTLPDAPFETSAWEVTPAPEQHGRQLSCNNQCASWGGCNTGGCNYWNGCNCCGNCGCGGGCWCCSWYNPTHTHSPHSHHPHAPHSHTPHSHSLAQAAQDPHFTLAHGGKADFRGKHNAYYTFLSSRNVTLNIKTENATFNLGESTIHGSFMTEAHLAMLTTPSDPKAVPRWFNVSFWASQLNSDQWSWSMLNGTCSKVSSTWGGRKVSPFMLGPHNSKSCDNLNVTTGLAKLTIHTPEWEINIFGQPVYGRIDGPHHRLDVELAQKKSDAEFVAKPHGLVGQSFDGDDAPRHGRVDVYPPSNAPVEFTTSAMAEGAIDGVAADYEMPSPYETRFQFSAFGAGPTAEQMEPWWERRRRRLREQRQRLARARASERVN